MIARHMRHAPCAVCHSREASKYCFDCGSTICDKCLFIVSTPNKQCNSCGEHYTEEQCPKCGDRSSIVIQVITTRQCGVCESDNIEELDMLFSKYPSTILKLLHTLEKPFEQLTRIGTEITTNAVLLETIRESGLTSCGVIEEYLESLRDELLKVAAYFDKRLQKARKDIHFYLEQLKYFKNLNLGNLSLAEDSVRSVRERVERINEKITSGINKLKSGLAEIQPYKEFVGRQYEKLRDLPPEIRHHIQPGTIAGIIGPVKGVLKTQGSTLKGKLFLIFGFDRLQVITMKSKSVILSLQTPPIISRSNSVFGKSHLVVESPSFTLKIKDAPLGVENAQADFEFLATGAGKYAPPTKAAALAHSPIDMNETMINLKMTLGGLFRFFQRQLFGSGVMGYSRPMSSQGVEDDYSMPFLPNNDNPLSPGYRDMLQSELYATEKAIEALKASIQPGNIPDETIQKISKLYRKKYYLDQKLREYGYSRYSQPRRVGHRNNEKGYAVEYWDDEQPYPRRPDRETYDQGFYS